MSERFQVPKHEISARVLLPGGSRRELTLYLGERAARHSGPERPSDLLNGDERFVPVRFPERGFALLRRRSIVAVRVDAEDELAGTADDEELFGPDAAPEGVERREVRIVLEDGTEVTGTIAYAMPPGERRLQDYLNRGRPFVRVREGDHVDLVNSERVVRVEPL